MTASLVQSNSGGSTGATTSTLAYLINNAAGNLLCIGGRIFVSTATSVTVADSANGAWTVVQTLNPQSAVLCFVAYRANCNAGANTVTISTNGGVNTFTQSFLAIMEYAGVLTATPLDASTAFATGTSATATTPSITTTGVNDLGIMFAANETTVTPNWSPPAGYAQRQPTVQDILWADNFHVPPSSFTLSATAGVGSVNWECLALAFKTIQSGGVPGAGDLGPGYDFKYRL